MGSTTFYSGFENFLSSQESLAHQMVEISIFGSEREYLFSSKKNLFDKDKEKKNDGKGEDSSSKSDENKKGQRYFRCNKIGHIKRIVA